MEVMLLRWRLPLSVAAIAGPGLPEFASIAAERCPTSRWQSQPQWIPSTFIPPVAMKGATHWSKRSSSTYSRWPHFSAARTAGR